MHTSPRELPSVFQALDPLLLWASQGIFFIPVHAAHRKRERDLPKSGSPKIRASGVATSVCHSNATFNNKLGEGESFLDTAAADTDFPGAR